MQARVLALALCLSYVSVSLTSRCSVETAVFLARELPSSYLALLKDNSLIFKNMGTSLCGNLSKTPDLENFASAYIDHRNVLST